MDESHYGHGNEPDRSEVLLGELVNVLKHLNHTLSCFMPSIADLSAAVDENTKAVTALPDRVAAAIAAGSAAEVPQAIVDQINANTTAVNAVAPAPAP